MPRGQKPGWRDRQRPVTERPEKPTKQETGIWLYPSGRFGAFLYRGKESIFLGTCETLAAARELRVRTKEDEKRGQAAATRTASRITMADFFEKVYEPEILVGRKASTQRAARSRYSCHLAPFFGECGMGSIDYTLCSKFRSELVARDDLSGQTKREVIMLLRQITEEGVRRGLLPKNPATLLVLPPKAAEPRTIPEYKTVKKIIAGIAHPVARALAETLVRSGLRLNEATALQWGDISFKKATITVCRAIDQATGILTTPKTATSFRTVDVPPSLLEILQAYQPVRPKAAWVFPSAGAKPFNDRNFQQRHWAPAVKKAKAGKITPHALRHVFASHLLQQGAERLYVARQLGHTSGSFTLKQYGHLLLDSSPSQAKLVTAFPD